MSVWKRHIAILIVLQVVLGTIYLSRVPRIFVDEAWDSSLGYNLAFKGSLSHPFIEGFGGMDVHFVQSRVVLPFICAAIFKVAGYSIFTSRISSVLLGMLAVICLYAVTRRWFGEKQAFWIGLATVVHPWFFEVSRRARPEIYYTAFALVFLWLLVLFFDSGSRRTAFFVGALAGLLCLTHPNGLLLIFSIGLAVFFWLETKSIARLVLWATAALAIVILPYIIYVLWATQDPQVSFTEQMQASMAQKSFLHSEIIRWRTFLQWPKGAPLAIVMFVSWIAAWYRSSSADKTLATIIALLALLLTFATVNPTARYLSATVPFFSALVIRLCWRLIDGTCAIWPNRYKLRFAISICTVLVYLSTCIAAIGLMFYRLRGANFYKVINHTASVITPDSRIYSHPIFWFGNGQYQYGPWLYIPENEPMIVREAINWALKNHFDYAVRTAWRTIGLDGIGRPPRSMPDFDNSYLCDHICRIFGTKIDEFYDPYYGPIEIYKLDWNKRF